MVFKVAYNPKRDHFTDYYPYALWQFEADQRIRAFLDQRAVPFVLLTIVSANVAFEPTQIP